MSERTADHRHNSESSGGDGSSTCVVCFKTVCIFSIGCCDHPVCYECSTRMRILCKQNECPICRQDMPKHRCYVCTKNTSHERRVWPLKTFQGLKEHMRREHELFYCDLCVDNLKIFTFERRVYTRAELGLHRRKGDRDDTSHRGHPLCEFCDTRYMDSDELFRHLRRDHLFCHFCDADGKHQFYSTYNDLRNHFKTEHFLCEDGDCKNEQFTSAFRTDIDLKAHIASTHSKGMSRQANKLARTLELEFTLAPRPRPDTLHMRPDTRPPRNHRPLNINTPQRNNITLIDHTQHENTSVDNPEPGGGALNDNNHPGDDSRGRGRSEGVGDDLWEELVLQLCDFPSLGGASSVPIDLGGGGGRVTFTSRVVPNFSAAEFPTLDGVVVPTPARVTIKKQKEDYPCLASNVKKWAPEVTINQEYVDASKSDSVRRTNVKVSYKNQQEQPSSSRSSNFSIELNHKKAPSNNKPSKVVSATSHPATKHNAQQAPITSTVVKVRPPRPPTMSDAFPALGSSAAAPAPAPEPSQWVHVKTRKKDEPKISKVAPAPLLPPTNDLADFPTLTKGKGKKSSSVTLPVSNNWVNLNEINKLPPKHEPITQTQPNQPSNIQKTKKKPKPLKPPPPSPHQRSELHIHPLQPTRAPPGFTHHPTNTPTPPPGFANDFTFTSSSGESYPITAGGGAVYRPPPNFAQRNKRLVDTLLRILASRDASGDMVKEFKSYSDLFRTGGYPARKYYEHCRLVLAAGDFDTVFAELLALLPDVRRQRELYACHLERGADGLEVCAICGQVLMIGDDGKAHVTSHALF